MSGSWVFLKDAKPNDVRHFWDDHSKDIVERCTKHLPKVAKRVETIVHRCQYRKFKEIFLEAKKNAEKKGEKPDLAALYPGFPSPQDYLWDWESDSNLFEFDGWALTTDRDTAEDHWKSSYLPIDQFPVTEYSLTDEDLLRLKKRQQDAAAAPEGPVQLKWLFRDRILRRTGGVPEKPENWNINALMRTSINTISLHVEYDEKDMDIFAKIFDPKNDHEEILKRYNAEKATLNIWDAAVNPAN